MLGESPRSVDAKKRIGYLPEETYLYRYLTAFETLDFFGSLFNLSKAERRSRADQLLEMVGLSHARNRIVGEFSKGMARRIGLAQAMINDPEFLVLDEPTSGLDPIGCREVKDLILTLKKRGKTVLVTSHLLSDMEDVCDRVVILYGGKIRAGGSLNTLLKISTSDTVTLPHLEGAAMKKMLSMLREFAPEDQIRISQPHMTLEEFFLDVVAKAKADTGNETAGAQVGSGVAEYLSAGTKTETGEKLLKKLSGEEKGPVPEKLAAAPEKLPDESVLNQLKAESPDVQAQRAYEQALARDQEKLTEANAKLQSLLGGTKKD